MSKPENQCVSATEAMRAFLSLMTCAAAAAFATTLSLFLSIFMLGAKAGGTSAGDQDDEAAKGRWGYNISAREAWITIFGFMTAMAVWAITMLVGSIETQHWAQWFPLPITVQFLLVFHLLAWTKRS